MRFEVTINNDNEDTDFTLTGNSNGFLDAQTMLDYRRITILTGTATSPTFTVGEQFFINDVPITLVTGTSLANAVTDINAQTNAHKVVASVDTNKLVLTPQYGHSRTVPTIRDITSGIVERVGFVSPVKSAVATLPTTLDQTTEKARGNIRWSMMLEQLQQSTNIFSVIVTAKTGGSITASPTQIKFFLEVPNNYSYNYDGVNYYGLTAVQRAIAKVYLTTVTRNAIIYNPTDVMAGDDVIPAGDQMFPVTVSAFTDDYSEAVEAITVLQLP